VNDVQLRNPMYAELNRVIDSYRDVKGPLIQVLHRAQEIFGYLPPRGAALCLAANGNSPLQGPRRRHVL